MEVLTKPTHMDDTVLVLGMKPDTGNRCGIEILISLFWLALLRHTQSKLKKKVEPFFKGNAVIVSRYYALQWFFGGFAYAG